MRLVLDVAGCEQTLSEEQYRKRDTKYRESIAVDGDGSMHGVVLSD